MNNKYLVRRVAAALLDRMGNSAVPYLDEQAMIAEGNGDDKSAGMWREIAEAARAIFADKGRSSKPCTGDNL